MSKFGPSRGEDWFRLCAAIFGLGLLIFAKVYTGGDGWYELAAFGGVFLLWLGVTSARRLLTRSGE